MSYSVIPYFIRQIISIILEELSIQSNYGTCKVVVSVIVENIINLRKCNIPFINFFFILYKSDFKETFELNMLPFQCSY